MNTITETTSFTKQVTLSIPLWRIIAGDVFSWGGRQVTCAEVRRQPGTVGRIICLVDGTEIFASVDTNGRLLEVTRELPVYRDYVMHRISTRREVGSLSVPAATENCFFGKKALFDPAAGFFSGQVRVGDMLLVPAVLAPIFPGEAGHDAITVDGSED